MADNKLDFVVITGMSGAGKSQAANALEDIGYYCIDNIPPMLIPNIVDLGLRGGEPLSKIAVTADLRGGEMFDDVERVLDEILKRGITPRVLFLDASDEELIRRYKENRRSHPLSVSMNVSVAKALGMERQRLSKIKSRAMYVVDTTLLSSTQLKRRVDDLFTEDAAGMQVQVLSFGFKYGPCVDADLVFDVRCLPNPFYIDELREQTGLQAAVQDYVMSFPQSGALFSKISDLIRFSLPLYENEGKSQLVIAFGCTGGKHRSVTFAQRMAEVIKKENYHVLTDHRDIDKKRTV